MNRSIKLDLTEFKLIEFLTFILTEICADEQVNLVYIKIGFFSPRSFFLISKAMGLKSKPFCLLLLMVVVQPSLANLYIDHTVNMFVPLLITL